MTINILLWCVFSILTVTHVFCHVDVGQAAQAEDVALLTLPVDFGESLLCCTQRYGICTRPLLHAILLHRCTVDVQTPQRQQHRQQNKVLHGKGFG